MNRFVPRSALVPALFAAALVGACSLDSTNPGGTGTGGGASSGGPSSNGVTQPTSGTDGASTASGMGGMATSSGNAMTTATTDAASSSTDAASSSVDVSSSVASSSSGGPTDYPFCTTLTDTFDSYGSDMNFANMAEIPGPWWETGANFGSVFWQKDVAQTGGQIQAKFEGGESGYLYSKNKLQLPATPCALTVRVVSVNGGDHISSFSLGNGDQFNPQGISIQCKANTKTCKELSGFGFSSVANITPPFTLGIVVKALHVTALYHQNGMWNLLPTTATAPGFDISTWAAGGIYIAFGQETGNDHSEWDDFNVLPVPVSAAP